MLQGAQSRAPFCPHLHGPPRASAGSHLQWRRSLIPKILLQPSASLNVTWNKTCVFLLHTQAASVPMHLGACPGLPLAPLLPTPSFLISLL